MVHRIHFWQLPAKRIHVLLEPEFKKDLISSFLKKAKTLDNASKMLGYSLNTTKRLRNKDKKIKIDIIVRLSRLLPKKFNLHKHSSFYRFLCTRH